MSKPSSAQPYHELTSPRPVNLILGTLLVSCAVYGAALIAYGEKMDSIQVFSPPGEPISIRSSDGTLIEEDLSIFFRYDCSNLSLGAQARLMQFAVQLKAERSLHIRVEGHCDQPGSKAYNTALGRERADIVKDFLVNHGLSGDHIETLSFGEERPLAEGSSETIWSKNRRATIRLSKPDQNQGDRLAEY